MFTVLLDVLAVALLVLGLAVITVSLYGVARQPDIYGRLHAAGMASGFGVIAVLIASIATRNTAVITHAVLVAAFLLLTTPLASHAIARAAYCQHVAKARKDESGQAGEPSSRRGSNDG
jgi:multicomponent Na+:H+ antiporter subunit G